MVELVKIVVSELNCITSSTQQLCLLRLLTERLTHNKRSSHSKRKKNFMGCFSTLIKREQSPKLKKYESSLTCPSPNVIGPIYAKMQKKLRNFKKNFI